MTLLTSSRTTPADLADLELPDDAIAQFVDDYSVGKFAYGGLILIAGGDHARRHEIAAAVTVARAQSRRSFWRTIEDSDRYEFGDVFGNIGKSRRSSVIFQSIQPPEMPAQKACEWFARETMALSRGYPATMGVERSELGACLVGAPMPMKDQEPELAEFINDMWASVIRMAFGTLVVATVESDSAKAAVADVVRATGRAFGGAKYTQDAVRSLLRFAYVDPANQQHIPGCSVGPAPRMRG